MTIFPRKFDCHRNCSSRKYWYVFPSSIMPQNYFEGRLECLVRLNYILSLFEGAHFFHNFSRMKEASQKGFHTFQRYVNHFKVRTVFGYKGEEFIILEVEGQSFIYHQIRKMVAFAIRAIRKDDFSKSELERCFHRNCDQQIPLAPSVGLFLRSVGMSYIKSESALALVDSLLNSPKSESFIDEMILPEICEKALDEGEFEDWICSIEDEF
ncbi:tRNA pseudouridine synthase 1 [Bonamia ostreae]|uniref:tRNA pseudouridine synthase n=1 Tax=Bonamia ostreae TaxID=126728 RepID=A0ABV2AMI9_9EUKA